MNPNLSFFGEKAICPEGTTEPPRRRGNSNFIELNICKYAKSGEARFGNNFRRKFSAYLLLCASEHSGDQGIAAGGSAKPKSRRV